MAIFSRRSASIHSVDSQASANPGTQTQTQTQEQGVAGPSTSSTNATSTRPLHQRAPSSASIKSNNKGQGARPARSNSYLFPTEGSIALAAAANLEQARQRQTSPPASPTTSSRSRFGTSPSSELRIAHPSHLDEGQNLRPKLDESPVSATTIRASGNEIQQVQGHGQDGHAGNGQNENEGEWETMESGEQRGESSTATARRGSNPSSPRAKTIQIVSDRPRASPRARTSGTSLARIASRDRPGSGYSSASGQNGPPSLARSISRDDDARRRSRITQRSTPDMHVGTSSSRVPPLVKRFGEAPPASLLQPPRQQPQQPALEFSSYPDDDSGGLDFSAHGLHLDPDSSMDGILDRTAVAPNATRPIAGPGETTGQAGANIAPWLMDDQPKSPGATSPFSQNIPGRQQFPQQQLPTAPGLRRLPSGNMAYPDQSSAATSRAGSVFGAGAGGGHQAGDTSPQTVNSKSRNGSGDSIQTLSSNNNGPKKPVEQAWAVGGGRHSNSAAGRISRFGSTASNVSGNSGERKKGFFGLLKRKNTAMTLGESIYIAARTDIQLKCQISIPRSIAAPWLDPHHHGYPQVRTGHSMPSPRIHPQTAVKTMGAISCRIIPSWTG